MRGLLAVVCLVMCCSCPAGAQEQRLSYINLPIKINLAVVEQRANQEIPQPIVAINENNLVCVEAKKAKYEYPCFKGLKWYSCDGWTYISPEIKCDVWGSVDKAGELQLSGEGSTLKMSIPIHARVSAEAAGVQETADAGAVVKVAATPGIDADWNVTLAVTPDFEWTQRPELMLFGLIKITIGSKVEPELRKHMDKLVAEIPEILRQIKLREQVASVWDRIQDPVKLSGSPETYALFKPVAVGFSGLSIENNILRANVSVAGETRVVVGPAPAVEKVPLVQLATVPLDNGGFSLDLPISAKFTSLLAAAEAAYPQGLTIDTGKTITGTLSIRKLDMRATDTGKLRLSASLTYDNRADWLKALDVFGWFDVEGVAYFEALPVIDEGGRAVRLQGVAFDAATSSGLVNTLVDLAQMPPVLSFIENAGRYDFGPDIDKLLAEANAAMTLEYDAAKLSGNITSASLHDVVVRPEEIGVTARAAGAVQVEVGL